MTYHQRAIATIYTFLSRHSLTVKYRCQSCGVDDATAMHTCPYKEDVHGNCETCNCCAGCTNNCCDEI